jgi:hypothetical protein
LKSAVITLALVASMLSMSSAQAEQINPRETMQALLMITGAYDRNGDSELDGRDWAKLSTKDRKAFVLYATTISLLGGASLKHETIDDAVIKRMADRQAKQFLPLITSYYAKNKNSKTTIFDVMNIYFDRVD